MGGHHTRRRVSRRTGGVVVAIIFAGALPFSVAAIGAMSSANGVVAMPAKRGTGVQVTDTVPVPPTPTCQRLIAIGDSLTEGTQIQLTAGFRAVGIEALVDGMRSRRIPEHVRAPYSGVKAAHVARLGFGEADCWVIALGTNDLIHGAFKPDVVDAWISAMLDAVTPGARVWWVNVDYHRDPTISFNFASASVAFNSRLSHRASADSRLVVIDWYSLAQQHRHWFVDDVHVNSAGRAARTQQTIAAVTG